MQLQRRNATAAAAAAAIPRASPQSRKTLKPQRRATQTRRDDQGPTPKTNGSQPAGTAAASPAVDPKTDPSTSPVPGPTPVTPAAKSSSTPAGTGAAPAATTLSTPAGTGATPAGTGATPAGTAATPGFRLAPNWLQTTKDTWATQMFARQILPFAQEVYKFYCSQDSCPLLSDNMDLEFDVAEVLEGLKPHFKTLGAKLDALGHPPDETKADACMAEFLDTREAEAMLYVVAGMYCIFAIEIDRLGLGTEDAKAYNGSVSQVIEQLMMLNDFYGKNPDPIRERNELVARLRAEMGLVVTDPTQKTIINSVALKKYVMQHS